MAKRIAKAGGRRRLYVLGGIAALSLVVVVIAIGQQDNKSADTDVLRVLEGEVPQYPVTQEEAEEAVRKKIEEDPSLAGRQSASEGNPTPDDTSGTASSGGSNTNSNASSGSGPLPNFNSNDAEDNDPECPVTGCNGPYENDEPIEEQKSGEQILADLASGAGLESTLEARHEALEKARGYFEDSVAANPTNEDAYYSLAYVYANLAGTYFSNDDDGDDDQGVELLEKARSTGEEAKTLASDHNNSTIASLSTNLIEGVSDYIASVT